MVLHLYWHFLTLLLFKHTNSLMEFFWHQLFHFLLWLYYFFFFVLYLSSFCHIFYFHHPLSFWSFLLLFSYFSPLFASTILTSPTLVFTACHTSLNTLSFSPPLFSSWSQSYGMPAILSPKSHSTSVYQSYFSPSSTILHKVAKSFTAITISLSVHVHYIRVSSHSSSFSLQKIFNHCICPFYPFYLSRSYWYLLYLLSPWLYLRREKP